MAPHKKHTSLPTPSLPITKPLYSQLFSKTSDLVLVISLSGDIEYANPAAEAFFKFVRQTYVGEPIARYWDGDLLNKFKETAKRVCQGASQLRSEVDYRTQNHRVVMELTISARTEGKKVTGFYVNARDISHERQIQELIRESQKMEALQYFVAGTTKEIQHPLMAILRKIEDFEGRYSGRSFEYVGYKEFSQIMNFLRVIREQIKTCYDTTAKLANLNKKRLKFESYQCSATDIIREMMKVKEANLNDDTIKFRSRLSDRLPLIALGEIEFNEILGHIIDNSLQAMPGGGQLLVTNSLSNAGQEVRIDISDDGVGIASQDLPHIFEPFFSTKQHGVQRSSGLGLSIVYSLVKAAHGQIKIKSSLRKGTSVQLIFPVVEIPSKTHRFNDKKHSRK